MPIPLSAATLSLGRRVCTALLGVDQLARCDGEDYALVVVNMDLGLEFAPEPYGTWDEARVAWEVIQLDAAKLPELDRRTYYDQLCRSTLCFIAWRHKGISFQEQLAGFLHCAAQPATEAELQAIQDEIYELLGGLGYNGDLAERCAAWEESCRVPAEHVPAVASQLMSEAWDRCNSDLLPDGIPAPKSDAMQVKPVSGVAFNARCGYLDRTIELNVDPVLTLPSLKHLAVHEACPVSGHRDVLAQRFRNSLLHKHDPLAVAKFIVLALCRGRDIMYNSKCANTCIATVKQPQMSFSREDINRTYRCQKSRALHHELHELIQSGCCNVTGLSTVPVRNCSDQTAVRIMINVLPIGRGFARFIRWGCPFTLLADRCSRASPTQGWRC
jgi:hypothetical protein